MQKKWLDWKNQLVGVERAYRVAVASNQSDWIECLHSFPDIPFSLRGGCLVTVLLLSDECKMEILYHCM